MKDMTEWVPHKPLNQFAVVIQYIESRKNKITISPTMEEVRIKFGDDVTDPQAEAIKAAVGMMLLQEKDRLLDYTMRGSIKIEGMMITIHAKNGLEELNYTLDLNKPF